MLAVPAVRAEESAPAGVDFRAMDGSVLTQDQLGEGVPGFVVPQSFGAGGAQFPKEMAVLSRNFQTILVLWSGEYDPDDRYALHDPSDPSTSESEGKCSFAQPRTARPSRPSSMSGRLGPRS